MSGPIYQQSGNRLKYYCRCGAFDSKPGGYLTEDQIIDLIIKRGKEKGPKWML